MYTKGPWNIDGVFVQDVEGWDVCEVSARQTGTDKTEWKDNAALIAAAPDLLEALEDMEKWFVAIGLEEDEDGELCPEIIKARAAIKKAKGEK